MAAFWWKLPVVAVFLVINLDEVVKLPAVISHYRKYGWLQNITRTNITKSNITRTDITRPAETAGFET